MSAASEVLGMSDEDFLKNPPYPEAAIPASTEKVVAVSEDGTETPIVETTAEGVVENKTTPPQKTKTETAVLDPHAEGASRKGKKAAVVESTEDTQNTEDVVSTQKTSVEGDDEDDESEATGVEVEETTAETSPDYETFYNKVMKPFKANGKTIELKTPEEAIQLMQMGANYTKKMQELVPARKVLTMLQNNGLMDEGKLSYLIDLDKKNPEAIKKLIKDAGLDPQEIDTSVEPAYREGNHRVSDDEVAFNTTLEDMKSTPERLETLKVINGRWDQASKEALWKSPDIMTVIHDQRENGVYDRIVNEVERRQTLGQIPANVPFLQAYKVVGDEMTAANKFVDLAVKPAKTAKTVVATRVVAPKSTVTNGDRAAAASSNRRTPATAKAAVNLNALSDDEFLKQFNVGV